MNKKEDELLMYKALYYKEKKKLQNIINVLLKYDYLLCRIHQAP